MLRTPTGSTVKSSGCTELSAPCSAQLARREEREEAGEAIGGPGRPRPPARQSNKQTGFIRAALIARCGGAGGASPDSADQRVLGALQRAERVAAAATTAQHGTLLALKPGSTTEAGARSRSSTDRWKPARGRPH